MGSQVRWRTVPSDIAEFQVFAEQRGWLLLPFRAQDTSPDPLLDWADCRSGVLVRATDTQQVRWKPAKTGTWWVDKLGSPVIEYGPGHRADGVPFGRRGGAQGRMWFATSYLRDGRIVPADPDFVRAARAILNWPRRHWKLVNTDYESPGAFAILEDAVC